MFGHDPPRTGQTESPVVDVSQLLWKFKTGDTVTSSPAVVNGVLYMGSWDSYVYALDAKNGNVILTYKAGDGIAASTSVH